MRMFSTYNNCYCAVLSMTIFPIANCKMKRLNITLSDDVAELLSSKPNKSRYIAEVLREKAELEKQERLRELLVEGYKSTRDEARTVNEEWDDATLKSWDRSDE